MAILDSSVHLRLRGEKAVESARRTNCLRPTKCENLGPNLGPHIHADHRANADTGNPHGESEVLSPLESHTVLFTVSHTTVASDSVGLATQLVLLLDQARRMARNFQRLHCMRIQRKKRGTETSARANRVSVHACAMNDMQNLEKVAKWNVIDGGCACRRHKTFFISELALRCLKFSDLFRAFLSAVPLAASARCIRDGLSEHTSR